MCVCVYVLQSYNFTTNEQFQHLQSIIDSLKQENKSLLGRLHESEQSAARALEVAQKARLEVESILLTSPPNKAQYPEAPPPESRTLHFSSYQHSSFEDEDKENKDEEEENDDDDNDDGNDQVCFYITRFF